MLPNAACSSSAESAKGTRSVFQELSSIVRRHTTVGMMRPWQRVRSEDWCEESSSSTKVPPKASNPSGTGRPSAEATAHSPLPLRLERSDAPLKKVRLGLAVPKSVAWVV